MNMKSGKSGRPAAGKQLNNSDSGFTLIELVVGVAVMMFVMLSLVVFVSVGTRGYSTSNAEVSVQMESQIALHQIEDIIMEGAGLSDMTESNGCSVYPVDMADGRVLLILDSENGRLLEYSQSGDDIAGENGGISKAVRAAVSNYREYVIAQGVRSLSLRQPDAYSSLVDVTVDFEYSGKIRTVSGSYRMRNFTAPE